MSSIILLGIKHCGKSTQGRLLSKHFDCSFFDTDDEVTALTGKTPREIYTEQGKEAFLEAERNACVRLSEEILKQVQNDTKQIQNDTSCHAEFISASKTTQAKNDTSCHAEFISASQGAHKINAVIATGGGICNNPPALEALHKIGKFVFLNADEKTAADRIVHEIKYDGVGLMKNLPAYIAKENPKNVQDVRTIFHNFYLERQKIYKDLCDIEVKLEHSATKLENMEKIIAMLE